MDPFAKLMRDAVEYWSLFGKAILRAWPVFIILFGVFVFSFFYWETEPNTQLDIFRQIMLNSSGTALFLGVIYNLVNFINSGRRLEESLLRIISADVKIISRIDENSRRSMIHNIVRSLVGERYGTILFTDIIDYYLRPVDVINRKLSFIVSCYDKIDLRSKNARVQQILESYTDESRFIWVEQIKNAQPLKVRTRDVGTVRHIFLGFDRHSYLASFSLPNIIGRTYFVCSDDILEEILNLDQSDLDTFISDFVVLKIHDGFGNNLSQKIEFVRDLNNPNQSYIMVSVDFQNDESLNSGYKIVHREPKLRTRPFFSLEFAHPTEEPYIHFSKASSMTNLQCNTYLTPQNPDRVFIEPMGVDSRDGPQQIRVTTRGWTYPTSGVVFIWQDRNI